MSEEKSCPQPGEFSWNELVTTDEAAAKIFYTGLFRWTVEPFGGNKEDQAKAGDDKNYNLFKQGDTMVGGLMKRPKPGMPAHWLAYVSVEDVDATAVHAVKLGGQVMMPSFDVPDVGRVAVLKDLQGAPIGLFKPAM